MKYKAGTMVDVYEWDTGKFLGTIEQAAATYSVVGNINQHQLAIGETTYGGRGELTILTGLSITEASYTSHFSVQKMRGKLFIQ
jgi:hypothetical protein